jgi:hypothetical protein
MAPQANASIQRARELLAKQVDCPIDDIAVVDVASVE